MLKLAQLSLAVFLSVVLVSCSAKPNNQMVGTWKQVDGTQKMHFHNDGTLTVLSNASSMEGVYKILDEDTVRLEIGDLKGGANMIWEASYHSDELSFTGPSGKLIKFQKEQ